MPSFILRNLDPVFWGRVRAKAALEGTSVYDLIVRLLSSWLAALLLLSTIACGYENPTQPTAPVVQPTAGVPTRIELTGNSGLGEEAGSGRITARVLDGLSHSLPNVTVTFTASLGTLGASQVTTDENGKASTTITGPAGPIAISAIVGTVEQKTLIAIQAIPPAPPVNVPPAIPPAPTPAPAPPPPAPTAPSLIVGVTTSASSVPVGSRLTFTVNVGNLQVDETVSTIEWDLDGDGDFEAFTVLPHTVRGSEPYMTAGFVTATVRVTTSTGRTGSGSLRFVVTN